MCNVRGLKYFDSFILLGALAVYKQPLVFIYIYQKIIHLMDGYDSRLDRISVACLHELETSPLPKPPHDLLYPHALQAMP